VVGVGLILGVSLTAGGAAMAQNNSAPTTATPSPGSSKPNLTKGPTQKSLPSSAPDATRTKTTGATNQSKTVKTMNNNAKEKVETEGK
jgi:hypothetical protein